MGHRVHIYPHNDLMNLAHYHREVIQNKLSQKSEEALALDCMSCLIALAFSVEAIVNFVGSSKVKEWNEKSNYHQKMNNLGKVVGFQFDESTEPYTTLGRLRELRNAMAHGKPIEKMASVSSKVELKEAMAMPWDAFLTPEFSLQAFEQVKSFELALLENAGIPIGATLTSAFGSWSEA